MEEIKQLAGVPTQIISPRECKPIISIVQDVALGVYRITKPHVRLTEKNLFNILSTNQRFNGIAPAPGITEGKIKKWTGRQVLSTIIPKMINVDMRSNTYDETKDDKANVDSIITIRNGEILSGVFEKDVYQARSKGLIHSIYNECGSEETREFFDNTQKYICNFLVLDGFSVGVSDLITESKTQKDFQEIISKMKTEVYQVINKAHTGSLENNTTKSNHENFERIVNDVLNDANKEVGSTGLKRIDANTNRLMNMIKSKSKGNTINVAQMIGCVGQVNIEGRRITNGFDDRTLPHYAKYDDGPESRGFVENSFIRGLTPQEFFFHAMGGREGLIDTAVGTSETGYIQRKLVKAMEDCKVNFDGSVRNASGAIVQFLYGDDGMDACKVESQPVPYYDHEIEKMLYDYQFTDDLKLETTFLDPKLASALKADKSWRDAHNKHVQQILEDKEFLIVKVHKCKNEACVMYPVSFLRIINNTAGLYDKYGCNVLSDLDPAYALEQIRVLEEEIQVNPHHQGNQIFQILLRAYMSPKRLIMRYRMTKSAFDAIIAQIKYRFHEALAHPSEMVGVVAAQSLGEPATQLTLNSVAYDTELLLNMDGEFKRVKIGEYIDQIMEKPYKLEEHPNDTKLAWLNDKVTVLSCDEEGKISWKRVEAVTRHPVVNTDGTNTVLKVTTKSGREVIATKAKSFLKRVDNKIMQVDGEELRVGDYLPVSMIVPFEDDDQKIKLLEIDDPTGYIPNVKLSSGEITIKLSELEDSIDKVDNQQDIEILNKIKKEQIFYDKVVNIQEISNPTPWVYDLTVEETRNFNIYNGLAMADKRYVGNSEL